MSHHARRHDAQMNAIDREHSRRNHEGGHSLHLGGRQGGKSATSAGGPMKMDQVKPTQKQARQGGKGDAMAIKRVAAGRPDTARGKNVA